MCREQPGPAVPQLSAALHAPIGGGSGRAAGEGEAPPGGAGTSGMPGTEVPPSLGAADAARRAKKLAQQQLRGAKLDSPDEPSWSLWMAPDRPMLMPLPQAQDSEQGHAAASPAGDGGRPAVPAGSGTGTGVGAPAGSAPASPAPGSAQLPGSGAAQGSAVQQQGSRPLGAAGGSSSPQPGSPQPSGPPTPGRRPRQGPSSPTLLQALCCCSSAVIPAPSREAVHFAVDFRSDFGCQLPCWNARRSTQGALPGRTAVPCADYVLASRISRSPCRSNWGIPPFLGAPRRDQPYNLPHCCVTGPGA